MNDVLPSHIAARVEHDTHLLELLREWAKAEARVAQISQSIAWYGKSQRNADMLTTEKALELDQRLESARLVAETAHNMVMAHEEAYSGWQRFYLVTSSAGHVHSSTSCSTCRPTTEFALLPQLSSHDVADLVEAVGPALCSVCFPDAPVAWLDGERIPVGVARKLFEDGPEAFRAALDKHRAKKAAAKDAGTRRRPRRPLSVTHHEWHKLYPSSDGWTH